MEHLAGEVIAVASAEALRGAPEVLLNLSVIVGDLNSETSTLQEVVGLELVADPAVHRLAQAARVLGSFPGVLT